MFGLLTACLTQHSLDRSTGNSQSDMVTTMALLHRQALLLQSNSPLNVGLCCGRMVQHEHRQL